MLRALGQKDSEGDVAALMRSVDLDGSGEISFAEFVRFMGDRGGYDSKRYRLQAQVTSPNSNHIAHSLVFPDQRCALSVLGDRQGWRRPVRYG